MKAWKKLALGALACVTAGLGLLGMTACAEEKQQLKYYLSEDGTYYLVAGIGSYKGTKLEIPKTYNKLPVKEIFDRAFYDCDQLQSVIIPDTITKVGFSAFEGCDNLQKAVVGDGLEVMTSAMFAGCKNLFSVTIGQNVNQIVVNVFEGCTRLVEVYNDSRLPLTAGDDEYGKVAYYAKDVYTDLTAESRVVTNKDGVVLHSDGETVSIVGYIGSKSEISMPEKVTVINDYAFDSVDVLKRVTVDGTVKTVGAYAFVDCANLQSVTLSSSVTTVAEGAFSNCDKLTSVAIGDKVTSIGVKAFAESDALQTVEIPNNVTELGKEAFLNCKGLKTVAIGNGVTTLNEKLFGGCSALTEVTVGEGVNRIFPKAFDGCVVLTSAKFAKTAVWWIAEGPVEASGQMVQEEVMKSPVSVAYYLTGEYKGYYWNRFDDVAQE